MTKLEFLSALQISLKGMPKEDIEKSLDYYSEMIDDRIEEGIAEEKAVSEIGPIDKIVSEIFAARPLPNPVKAKTEAKRSLRAWEIALIILGSPLWASLLMAAVLIIMSVYIVLWSVVLVVYAVVLCFAAGFITGIFGFPVLIFKGSLAQGLFYAGTGFVCAGLAILSFHLSIMVTKAIIIAGKKILAGIKRCFIRKEAVYR